MAERLFATLPRSVLGRTRCSNQSGVNYDAGFEHQVPLGQVGVDGRHDQHAQVIGVEKAAKPQKITDPIEVITPQYRKLDAEVRSANGKHSRSLAVFGALTIEQEIEPARMEAFAQKKATLQEDIETFQAKVIELKASRKATDRHIAIKSCPLNQR